MCSLSLPAARAAEKSCAAFFAPDAQACLLARLIALVLVAWLATGHIIPAVGLAQNSPFFAPRADGDGDAAPTTHGYPNPDAHRYAHSTITRSADGNPAGEIPDRHPLGQKFPLTHRRPEPTLTPLLHQDRDTGSPNRPCFRLSSPHRQSADALWIAGQGAALTSAVDLVHLRPCSLLWPAQAGLEPSPNRRFDLYAIVS